MSGGSKRRAVIRRRLQGLAFLVVLAMLLGVAVAFTTINLRGAIPLFSGSFLTIVIILEILHGR